MDRLIRTSDANSIERELQNVCERSLETNREQNPDDRNIGSSSSQNNEFNSLRDSNGEADYNRGVIRDNMETLPNGLIGRISREIGGLLET